MGHGVAADAGTRIEILGGVRIIRHDTTVELGSTRRAQLLARLAITPGQWVSADALLDDFWPDNPPTARTALQVQVGKLRRELEPGTDADTATLIQTGDGTYRLGLEPSLVDHVRFGALIDEARSHQLDRHVDLAIACLHQLQSSWGRPFGALGGHPAFVAAAARLDEAFAAAIDDLSSLEIEAGVAEIPTLQQRCREHPLRERRWAHLMVALYRAGRQADALRAYALARTTLVEEVGVEPGPDLQRLERRILDHDPELSAPEHHVRTPAASASEALVGRDADVAAAAKLLTTHRLVTIAGPGGVGKTRLARAVVETVAPALDGDVTWVSLAPTTDPELVAANIDDALENQRGRHQGAVVLDNCEHLRDAVGVAVSSLLESSDLRILLTSQQPIGIPAEHVVELPCLPVDGTDRAGTAQALFVDRMVAASAIEPTEADAPLIDRIVRAVDGLPLAVELVAGRTRSMTLGEILRDLEGGSMRLTRENDPDPRHRTMEAAVRWSTDLLSTEALRLFEDLSILEGSFDLPTAQALADADTKLREADVAEVLGELTDVSLLQRTNSGWLMLRPVRAVARVRLDERGDGADVLAAHAAWFASLARESAAALSANDRGPWLGRAQDATPDLLAALGRAARTGRVDDVLDLAPLIGRVLTESGSFAAAREALASADAATQGSMSRARCELLVFKGWCAMWDREPSAATASLQAAEAVAEEIDDAVAKSKVLHARANVAGWLDGRPRDAVPLFRASTDIASTVGETTGVASLATRGYMHAYLGEHDLALAVADEVQLLADLFDNDTVRFLAVSVWGWTYLLQGRLDDAEAPLRDQLRLCEQEGLVFLRPATQSRLAWLLAERGDLRAAQVMALEALTTAEEFRANLRLADSWWVLALIARLDERPDEAAAWLRRCAISAIATTDITMGAWTLAERGRLLDASDPTLAASLRSAAAELAGRHGLELPRPSVSGLEISIDAGHREADDRELLRLAALAHG